MTELNKKTQSHHGYFKDENTHYCSITIKQKYKDNEVNMNSKVAKTDDISAMFNEELTVTFCSMRKHNKSCASQNIYDLSTEGS